MHLTPIINMIHWIAKHFNIIKEAIIRILVNMNEIIRILVNMNEIQ